MSEMVERVAKSIMLADIGDQGAATGKAGILYVTYIEQARAAIEAMREPSEVMLKARFELYMTSNPWIEANKKSLYQAWIDAALKD